MLGSCAPEVLLVLILLHNHGENTALQEATVQAEQPLSATVQRELTTQTQEVNHPKTVSLVLLALTAKENYLRLSQLACVQEVTTVRKALVILMPILPEPDITHLKVLPLKSSVQLVPTLLQKVGLSV